MTLPAVIDAIEDAPADAERFYVRKGDKFVLDVRTVDGVGVGDIDRLTGALLESKLRAAIEKAGASADLVLPIALGRARLNPTTLAVEHLKDDGSPALIVIGGNDVVPGGAAELVDALAKDQRYAPAFEKNGETEARKEAVLGGNLTEQMRAMRAKSSSQPGQAELAEALKHGNPWREGSFNLTRQCVIARYAPQQAAAMRQVAA